MVQEGEGALLARVDTAIVLIARLTGRAVEALWMAELFTFLGLLPDAPRSEAQQPPRMRAGSTAGVSSGGRTLPVVSAPPQRVVEQGWLGRAPATAGRPIPNTHGYRCVEEECHGAHSYSPRRRGGRHHHRSP